MESPHKEYIYRADERGWFRTEPSRQKGKPDMGIILGTALEMAEGLEYLHSQGILHGDLSPGNVLLADNPTSDHGFTVKVGCFFTCKMDGETAGLILKGYWACTLEHKVFYMQAQSSRGVDGG